MTRPIDLGDWLALIEPMMSDLTNTSGEWWQKLMAVGTNGIFNYNLLTVSATTPLQAQTWPDRNGAGWKREHPLCSS